MASRPSFKNELAEDRRELGPAGNDRELPLMIAVLDPWQEHPDVESIDEERLGRDGKFYPATVATLVEFEDTCRDNANWWQDGILEKADAVDCAQRHAELWGMVEALGQADARRKIIKQSHGLPYYVHMLGKHSFRAAADAHTIAISSGIVDLAIKEFLEDTEQFYYDDYQTAVSSNQKDSQFKVVLFACARADGNESGFFSATSVISPLSRILRREVKHANFQRHLTEFMSKERGPVLIRRGSERQYPHRFFDPMMQPYILMRAMRDGLLPPDPAPQEEGDPRLF
jgi:uncharacterized protein YjhX (UPF0386 family)